MLALFVGFCHRLIDCQTKFTSLELFDLFLQFFGSLARSLIGTNTGEYNGLVAFMIPALTGLNKELNPNETLEITADQASWLRKSTQFSQFMSISNI